jgi:WD40 repeat protein
MAVSEDGSVHMLGLSGVSRTIIRDAAPIAKARFSPDSRLLATVTTAGSAVLWDSAKAVKVRSLGQVGGARELVFSADGQRVLAFDSSSKSMDVFGVRDGSPTTSIAQSSQISDAGLSPDGERVVTAGSDGTARVWSASGKLLLTLFGNKDRNVLTDAGIASACFTKDGNASTPTPSHTCQPPLVV